MTRFALALLVLLFPLALAAEDKKDAPFQSKDGKFSVALPAKPIETTNKLPSGTGQIVAHMFTVDQTNRSFLVTYTDYSKEVLKNKDAEKFLDSVAEGNANVLKGKMAPLAKIAIGKHKYPGREIRVEMPDKKSIYRARIFLVGDRLYQLVAIGADDFVKGQAANDFFKSFQIEE